MDAAPLSMLDQYRETFFHDALFAPDDVPAVGAGVHRSSRMKVVAGSGYMEQLLFKNGLLAGRGDYRLERAHDGVFGGMETCFGVSLMVAGSYALAIPELRFQKQMLVDQAWIRAGHVEAVHCTQPADQVLRGISIDVAAGLLEAWRDEAPKALNSGVRAVLQHSGPVLRPLPGVGRELRGLALRMLQLDSSSLCGRLELESLALDFLVRV
ncbi:AraC family transcriptional regulator, partial [Thioalkalicoccus limnaeus]